MPASYSDEIFSFSTKRDCVDLNLSKNYIITENTGYSIINKNIKEKKKVVCEDIHFKIDQEKYNSIVKKSFNK